MSYLRTCPRCNERGYEVLKTHAYCVNCNYSPDLVDRTLTADDLPVPAWAERAATMKQICLRPHTKKKTDQLTGGAA